MNNTMAKTKGPDVKKMVTLAMISAMAFVMLLISKQFPMSVPGAPYLTFDLKDSIIAIGAMMFGPIAGAAMSLVVSTIEMVTISSTGLYGLLMNVVSTCMLIVPAAIIYKRQHTLKGAIVGLSVGVLMMTASMLLWNYIITPIYMGYPREAVAAMLLPIFLPFNLLKGALNATIAMVLYKPIVGALRRARLVEESSKDGTKAAFKSGALIISIVALIAVLLLIMVYTGAI